MNMELFSIIASGISGTYLIMLAFMFSVKTPISMLFFKFVPFILGLTLYFIGSKMWGII